MKLTDGCCNWPYFVISTVTATYSFGGFLSDTFLAGENGNMRIFAGIFVLLYILTKFYLLNHRNWELGSFYIPTNNYYIVNKRFKKNISRLLTYGYINNCEKE